MEKIVLATPPYILNGNSSKLIMLANYHIEQQFDQTIFKE
jgi:hypothetical protein